MALNLLQRAKKNHKVVNLPFFPIKRQGGTVMPYNHENVFDRVSTLKKLRPLVHNITNLVSMQNVANILLAIDAPPLMAHAQQELEDILSIPHSKALVLNIGTLDEQWIKSFEAAQTLAVAKKIPVILDPVGAGASKYRTDTAIQILSRGVSVVRGNASEIMALVDKKTVTKGVETTAESHSAEDIARHISKQYSCVVVVSGRTDIIVNGDQVVYIEKPEKTFLTKVTGMGCAVTSVIGGFAAAAKHENKSTSPEILREIFFQAACDAMITFAVASAEAMHNVNGPGSFFFKLLDSLNNINHLNYRLLRKYADNKFKVISVESAQHTVSTISNVNVSPNLNNATFFSAATPQSKKRDRLSNEHEVEQKLVSRLPDNIEFGAAISQGECFFDAMAQALNAHKGKEVYSAKSLRLLCDDYVKSGKHPWVKDAVIKDGDNYEQYLVRIQFTTEEMEQKEKQGLKLGTAVWGRPHIEGRMMCEVCKVKLHVIEVHEKAIDGVNVLEQQIDANSSNSIDPMSEKNYTSSDTIHLVAHRNHFVPLLRKNRLNIEKPLTQFNEHSLSVASLNVNRLSKANDYYSVQLVADWDYTAKNLITNYDSIEGKEARNRAVINRLFDLVKDAVEGGKAVTCVLLRAKTAPKKYIIEACYQLIAYLRPRGVPFMVNDFVDVAKITGADGVHVGQDDMPVVYARQELGGNKIIGLSITNLENARVGATEDADYYAVGPIYPTESKTDADPAIGLEGLVKIRRIIANKPIIVIGGVKVENAAQLIEAKADGVSVIGAIMGAQSPRKAAEALNDIVHKRRQFEEAYYSRSGASDGSSKQKLEEKTSGVSSFSKRL